MSDILLHSLSPVLKHFLLFLLNEPIEAVYHWVQITLVNKVKLNGCFYNYVLLVFRQL